MNNIRIFKTKPEILRYLQDERRVKIGKTRFYEDIKTLIASLPDGTWSQQAVDYYADGLPSLVSDEKSAEKSQKLADLKARREIEKIEEQTALARIKRQRLEGQLIAREDVYLELVSRGLMFKQGLLVDFELRAMELVELVGGTPDKAAMLQDALTELVEKGLGRYTQEFTIEAMIDVEADFSED